jgi:hypothetical protein
MLVVVVLIILAMLVVVRLLTLLIRAARSRTGFGDKTLWDWLQLLIVPLVLVIGGFSLTTLQDARQRAIEDQRAQDTALQAYLDQMGSFLLERDLRTSKEDSEVRTLARARTLTVLARMDPSRRQDVMQFLVEAELVQEVEGRGPIIGLGGAQLRDVDLAFADLSGADLSDADLSDAYLDSTDLSGANLRFASLNNAAPFGLGNTHLLFAKLSEADLSHADLRYADLRYARLIDADLSSADLSDVDLDAANLSGAILSGADLSDAYLSSADLSGANLSRANLRGAGVITNEELEQQAASLKGATMPNGQKYEDWIKDKEGRGAEGVNPGPS